MKPSPKLMSICVLLIASFVSCTTDSNYVLKHSWKGGNGDDLPDFFYFDDGVGSMANDTIFINDIATAIVVSIKRRVLANDFVLTVKSIKTGELVEYYEM